MAWNSLTRVAQVNGSFRNSQELVFGIGAEERVLEEGNEALWQELIHRLVSTRQVLGSRFQPLWRLHPERWLESLVLRNLGALDERLDPALHYSQLPAFAASDRAMLDVLAVTREGRLAVLELKADEDIHLPLQGLDYWSRVQWHHAPGEFATAGYFAGRELSLADPLPLPGGSHSAHPSRHRHAAALPPSWNSLDAGRNRRALARWRARDFPQAQAPENVDRRAGGESNVREMYA